MQKQKPIAVFRGEFRSAIREYSFHRMERDPKYKKTVYKAISRRKAEQAKKKEEQRRARTAGSAVAAV